MDTSLQWCPHRPQDCDQTRCRALAASLRTQRQKREPAKRGPCCPCTFLCAWPAMTEVPLRTRPVHAPSMPRSTTRGMFHCTTGWARKESGAACAAGGAVHAHCTAHELMHRHGQIATSRRTRAAERRLRQAPPPGRVAAGTNTRCHDVLRSACATTRPPHGPTSATSRSTRHELLQTPTHFHLPAACRGKRAPSWPRTVPQRRHLRTWQPHSAAPA